jgi:hypothetical protein
MSTDRHLDEENMIYSYNVILYSLKKERNLVTYSNVDESGGHNVK